MTWIMRVKALPAPPMKIIADADTHRRRTSNDATPPRMPRHESRRLLAKYLRRCFKNCDRGLPPTMTCIQREETTDVIAAPARDTALTSIHY